MEKSSKAYVVLAGGLGNQLFQASALLGLHARYKIFYLQGISEPRLSIEGYPESLSLLDLPSRKIPWIFQVLLKRVVNLNLKYSVPDIENVRRTILAKTVKRFSEVIFSLALFERIRIANLVDEIPVAQRKTGTLLLVGYFQTRIFAENVKRAVSVNRSNLVYERAETLDLYHESQISMPIILHVRRSDYVLDTNFGLLSDGYYLSALKKLSASLGEQNTIWVFSDDIDSARTILYEIEPRVSRWISDVDKSASMSLLAMSFGKAHIIANSTFSWWGAYLSEKSTSVYYPESWLKGIPHRKDLFPGNWIPISSDYE
jgi:hypothetical protein